MGRSFRQGLRFRLKGRGQGRIYNAYGASPPPLAYSDFDLTLLEVTVLTLFLTDFELFLNIL